MVNIPEDGILQIPPCIIFSVSLKQYKLGTAFYLYVIKLVTFYLVEMYFVK
jgi:hypothetical protein